MTNKRRPKGIGKSANPAKKQKSSEEETLPTDEQTVILNDTGNELSDLRDVYDMALEKLATDAESAHSLLRGTIHECDRILRARASVDEIKGLPSKFYLTYGSAIHDLLMLDALAEGEDSSAYLELAKDMLETGHELAKEESHEDESMLSEIALALGKVLLLTADALMRNGPSDDQNDSETPVTLAKTAIQYLDEGIKGIPLEESSSDSARISEWVAVASVVQAHADLYDEQEPREKWNRWAMEKFERILKCESNSPAALQGLGNCYLSLANFWLEQADVDEEEGEDQDDEPELKEMEEHALGNLEKALKYFQKALTLCNSDDEFKLLCLIGETMINLGNIDSSEEGQKSLYKEAVANLKKARSLSPGENDVGLPEQFEAFIDEWEREME